jgi:ligand-binding SRPBCC domain-containing protein
MFADEMVRGPFKRWLHRHVVESRGESCVLIDDVQYELPLGLVGRWLGGWVARGMLERLFAYRHAVTRAACTGG